MSPNRPEDDRIPGQPLAVGSDDRPPAERSGGTPPAPPRPHNRMSEPRPEPPRPGPPVPTAAGLFGPAIGRASDAWPWALPAFYAINVAPGTTNVIAPVVPHHAVRSERPRRTAQVGWIELVGFWAGRFGLVSVTQVASVGAAWGAARSTFQQLPVRFLMMQGQITAEDPRVELTGTWPAVWTFRRVTDLGVLCAYIYDQTRAGGGREDAIVFRHLVPPPAAGARQLLMYLQALAYARAHCAPWLSPIVKTHLAKGFAAAKAWTAGR